MASSENFISKKYSVRSRLLTYILLTSSAVTLVLTLIQLSKDYFADLDYIENRMEEIRISRSETLSQALWNLDNNLIEAGLEGMLPIQDVIYVEISDQPGGDVPIGEAAYKKGEYDPSQAISFTQPLFYEISKNEETATLEAGTRLHLGDLKVVFSKEGIYNRLENKAILILFTQAIKTLLVSSLILLFIYNIITRHLARIANYFEDFDINNPDSTLKFEKKRVPASPEERDELDVVADAINSMSDKVRDHYKEQVKFRNQLQELNESLDHRVKEQTAKLAEEKRQITILLDNMKQAVFRVNTDSKIVAPISEYSKEIFGVDIEGKNVFDVVFSQGDLDTGTQESVRSALHMAYGESSLQWMLSEPTLPLKLRLEKFSKTVRLAYEPLYTSSDELSHILFVLEEVTELERLEEQRKKKDKELALLRSFASTSEKERSDYFSVLSNQLQSVESQLKAPLSKESLTEIYRTLHTIKGNARMLQFDEVAETTHIFENQISSLLDNLKSKLPLEKLEVDKAKQLAKTLREVCVKTANTGVHFFGTALVLATKQGSKGEQNQYHHVLKENLETLQLVVQNIQQRHNSTHVHQISQAVEQLLYVDLRDGFERLPPMVKEISNNLGKRVKLVFEGDNLSVPPSLQKRITDALIQVVRNSLDHGLEPPKERADAGKSKEGLIKVFWQARAGGDLSILIKDDGRGIDTERVLKKAWDIGIIAKDSRPSDKEVIQLIFEPTLSTSEQVSDISGRGVGMTVIGDIVKDLKGQVEVNSVLGRGTEISFVFKGVLPDPLRPLEVKAA